MQVTASVQLQFNINRVQIFNQKKQLKQLFWGVFLQKSTSFKFQKIKMVKRK